MDFVKYAKIRKEKFGAVIFDTLNEKVFVTNRTGADILQLIEERRVVDDIVRVLASKYSGEEIEKDAIDFIEDLREKGLLQ